MYNVLYIGYAMKQRGIWDLDHLRNWLFRCPECGARGHLIRFPRSRIPRLFHRIRYLYHTFSFCAPFSYRKVLYQRPRRIQKLARSQILTSCEYIGTVRHLNDNTHDRTVALLLSCRSLALIFALLKAHKLRDANGEVYGCWTTTYAPFWAWLLVASSPGLFSRLT